MTMLLMTVICHFFSRLSCFFWQSQHSPQLLLTQFTWRGIIASQKLSKAEFTWANLIQHEDAQKVKEVYFTVNWLLFRQQAHSQWTATSSACVPTICLYTERSVSEMCSQCFTSSLWENDWGHNCVIFSKQGGTIPHCSHHSSPLSIQSDIPIMPTCFRCLLLPYFFNSVSVYFLKGSLCPLFSARLPTVL